MTELGILERILQLGGPSAVAIVVIYLQQQNHMAYMKREADNAAVHRDDKLLLFQVLENNTAAKTELIKTTSQLVVSTERMMSVMSGFVAGREPHGG
jgi:hypothetical protein